MPVGRKNRMGKCKDCFLNYLNNMIFNTLASITGYKFLIGKKKGQHRKQNMWKYFFFPIPLSPNYCMFHPENLFLAFPALVQTAAAFILPWLSCSFLDKTLRGHMRLNYGGTSQIYTCPSYSQMTMMANLSDSIS